MKIHRASLFLFAVSLLPVFSVPVLAADTAKAATAAASGMAISAAKAAPANTSTVNAASSFESGNYKLRLTDVIGINVVDDAKASGEFKIDIDGNVLLPYLPDQPVKLAGLSTTDAAKAIIKAYVDQKIFVKPSITVVVKVAAPRYIIFLGQVSHQGKIEIPMSKEMTLSNALAEAGGPMPNADRYVTITRVNPDGTTKTLSKVDLKAAVTEGKDVPLQEGDIITLGQSLLGDVWH